TAQGTITPKTLTVTVHSASKVYDGTTAANGTVTVNGTIEGDSFTNASLAQGCASIHVVGEGNSTVNIAAALGNSSFASSTAGSVITDYSVNYITATGTVTAR